MSYTAVYRHPTASPAKKPNPISPRDRLATIACNQWLRPNERAHINAILADQAADDDTITRTHRDISRRIQTRRRQSTTREA